jgi:hypothetical protein
MLKPFSAAEMRAAPTYLERSFQPAALIVGGILLCALLVAWLPLFVCMPPWVDNTWYDLCARSMLKGEIVYQKIFWHGLPGMLWLQTGIRALFGWRSEILHAADAIFLALTIWLLVSQFLPESTTLAGRMWTAILLATFYSCTSEWCHCQPDMWMLLPAVVALWLRERQVTLILKDSSGFALPGSALLEGLCWSLALLIKPFVLVPAAACWLASLIIVHHAANVRRTVLVNTAWLIAGGVAAGAGTVAWLLASGNWPFFAESALGGYGAEYYARSPHLLLRLQKMVEWLWPWSLVHFLAVPFGIYCLASKKNEHRLFLLSAFYLGWFVQANFLQQHYMYHVVPVLLLGLALLACNHYLRLALLVGFLTWAAVRHPLLNREHLALWTRCWQEGSSSELRDQLTLQKDNPTAPDWIELERVKVFLRDKNLKDRELTCYCTSSVHLYLEMNLEPSTRYVLTWALMQLLGSHHEEMTWAMFASPQRYVVNDLRQVGLSPPEAAYEYPNRPFGVQPLGPRIERLFPWTEPIEFRAGRYLVHRVRPELRLRTDLGTTGQPSPQPATP